VDKENKSPLLTPYLQSASNIFAENKVLRFLFVGILLVSLFNTVAIQRISDDTKTVIIPAGQSVEYTFVGNTPSENYLRNMGLYVIYMIGNLTATNCSPKLTELTTLWHPSTAPEYKERFDKICKELEKYPSISYQSIWEASHPITYKPGEIILSYSKKKIVGKTIKATTTLSYKIEYIIESGQFSILHVKEIGGEDI
jgi:conjugal transfer pilus assembly protein TraE